MTARQESSIGGKSKHRVGFIEVMALSVAIMGPTGSMALNGSLTAATDGTATALAFVGATIVIALVAYSFVEFARKYAHAGSIYAFTGRSFGPRFGFISAWVVLFAYIMFAFAVAVLSANFLESALSLMNVQVSWIIPAIAFFLIMWFLAHRSVKLSTRTTMVIEGVSILVILILSGVILARGGAHGISGTPFKIGSGGLSKVALASVFGFLSFAAFEGAATLGEETRDPKRAIPRALAAAVLVTGIFYIFCIWVQAEGFGTTSAGVTSFASSSAPLASLAQSYVGTAMALTIDFGAMVSAFASGVGLFAAASRMLYALGRDGFGPPALGRIHPRYGSPYIALPTVLVPGIALALILYGSGLTAAAVFGDLGVLGVLALLVVYAATQAAAIRMFSREHLWRPVQFVIPVLAIVAIGYTIYANVWPVPASSVKYFPYIVLAWILAGIAIAVALPRLSAKIGRSFTDEGFEEQRSQSRAAEAL
jgi:amino acid transporter